MFLLYFHYENVSRQDPLLKTNHANVMKVPGLCKIRVVPKATPSTKNGKLVMEISCGQNLHSNVSIRFSGQNTGKLYSILDGNGFLRILPRTGRAFRDLRTYSRFNVTIVTSSNTQDETLSSWSGFLQKDEGETQ